MGYESVTSRDVRADEGKVSLEFLMEPAQPISLSILTPAGKPAQKAEFAMGVAGSQIHLENGIIVDSQTYAERLITDSDGQVKFPKPEGAYRLIIVHPSGYADIESESTNLNQPIYLTKWGRVKGLFRVDQQAGAGIVLEMSGGPSAYGKETAHIFSTDRITTDKNGRFEFDRVFAGDHSIGRQIVFMMDDGATEVASSKRSHFKIEEGQDLEMNLGGDGVAVTGRLVAPSNTERVIWRKGQLNIQRDLPYPPLPDAGKKLEGDLDAYRQWYQEWSMTPEGEAWKTDFNRIQEEKNQSTFYYASIDPDGNFRIDDMEAGDYTMSFRFDDGKPPGILTEYQFSVSRPDEKLEVNLGEIKLKGLLER